MFSRRLVKATGVDNLYMITSGYTPDNPSVLLGSPLLVRWIDQIKKTKFFDVIIFDTPPVLAVSDSAVLAGTIDIDILLVVRAGVTRRGAAEKSKERFETLDLQLTGVILNGANLRDEAYYGYDYSYYYRVPEQR